jgi:hypothetical protein
MRFYLPFPSAAGALLFGLLLLFLSYYCGPHTFRRAALVFCICWPGLLPAQTDGSPYFMFAYWIGYFASKNSIWLMLCSRFAAVQLNTPGYFGALCTASYLSARTPAT